MSQVQQSIEDAAAIMLENNLEVRSIEGGMVDEIDTKTEASKGTNAVINA